MDSQMLLNCCANNFHTSRLSCPSKNAASYGEYGLVVPLLYDITGLDAASSESVEGIDESVAVVRGIVDSEISLGILPQESYWLDFLRWGIESLHRTSIASRVQAMWYNCYVGYLCGSSRLKMTDGFEDVPLLHCHGTGDMVVRYDWAQKTKEAVEEKGIKSYDLRSYEGMAHTSTRVVGCRARIRIR